MISNEVRNSVLAAVDSSARRSTGVASDQRAQQQEQIGKGQEKRPAGEADKAASDLNRAMRSLNVKREFVVDKELEEVVVKIIDKDAEKVVRQIPTEEAVRLAKNIKDMTGLLFDSIG